MEAREFKDGIFAQLARVGGAFSSPKRVEIVDLLAQGERSVESIAVAAGMSVANTSRHLGVLRNAGLLSSRRDGLFVLYRVADESVTSGYRALRILAENRIAEVRQLASAFFSEVDGVEPLGLDELLTRSNSGDIVLVDVRPRLEYDAGHLPGAINIPIDDLDTYAANFDAHSTVVAYCRGPYCVMAAQAVALFREAGIDAQRLEGGPLEWSAAGQPLIVESRSGPTAFDVSVN